MVQHYDICWVYVIEHRTDDKIGVIYVGSSANYIQRMKQHRFACNPINDHAVDFNRPVYTYIRKHGGFINFQFRTIQVHRNITLIQLRQAEQTEIEKHTNLQNRYNAIYKPRSQDELREYNNRYYHMHRKNITGPIEHDKIFLNRLQPVRCDCGIILGKNCYKTHLASFRHKRYEADNDYEPFHLAPIF